MEIFTLLETLEDILESSKTIPFTDKSMIEKDQLLDIIKEIRLKLPDELKQAKWIKEERERIIAEAQKDADDIMKEAENIIISKIDEHEITKKAYDKKNEIIEEANQMYREMKNGANDYIDEILSNIENSMLELGKTLNNVETTIQNAVETIQNDRNAIK